MPVVGTVCACAPAGACGLHGVRLRAALRGLGRSRRRRLRSRRRAGGRLLCGRLRGQRQRRRVRRGVTNDRAELSRAARQASLSVLLERDLAVVLAQEVQEPLVVAAAPC